MYKNIFFTNTGVQNYVFKLKFLNLQYLTIFNFPHYSLCNFGPQVSDLIELQDQLHLCKSESGGGLDFF